MVSYETKVKKYNYRMIDLERLLKIIEKGNLSNILEWKEDNVHLLIDTINNFLQNIQVVFQVDKKERYETEEEARLYFGPEFIRKWNELLTMLDKQQTIVFIHGTHPSICPSICENGLIYKVPALTATACGQVMNYGAKQMDYKTFESLLNWAHYHHKGLIIIAVPYECFYKEGLWSHIETSDSTYNYEYRIDPDFIVGYIDVDKKAIILNPKYKRQHDYTNYEKDIDLFREQKDMDNDCLAKEMKNFKNELEDDVIWQEETHEEVDEEESPFLLEDLMGLLNSIKNGYPDGMSEERYESLLKELSNILKKLKKLLQLMNNKTL